MRTPIRGALLACLAAAGATPVLAQDRAPARHPFSPADAVAIRKVSDPAISPDGRWVAYVVTGADTLRDRRQSDVWMTSWDGSRTVQLTRSDRSETSPRFSPDGRWLSFLSDRDDPNEAAQLWLLDRAGGEAERITSLPGGVADYVWAPDGRRLALVVQDPAPEDTAAVRDSAGKRPVPLVIDRFQFKRDIDGYLRRQWQHVWLLDVATRRAELLTPGDQDDVLPAWSPDGRTLAFVSKRGGDPDRSNDWNLYAVDAAPGATARRLTSYDGDDNDPDWESRPEWSPDGKWIAYLRGGPERLIYYAVQRLALASPGGEGERVVSPALDRWVTQPHWTADGRSLYFLLEEDRTSQLARIGATGGDVERVVAGRRVVSGLALGPEGRIAVVASTPDMPQELYAVERGGDLRPLSRQNAELMARVELGSVEEISFKSRDGTQVGGFVVKPPGFVQGRRYPAVLRIHGGPVSQFQNEFDDQWQVLAAHGYVVVAANPRGSSGRGEKFAAAIYGDWGHKDAEDVLASVDYAVAQGVADPDRLGVGGWSYGAILTNYVIAQDRRFKAATSGAGISNVLAGYGTDQYVREYEAELGPPWRDTARWLRLSRPFLHADRIVTPTLFLAGEKDFNVPLLDSEQMYQALRSLGRPTTLVIYPGEFHGLRRPSFVRDRLERYLAWYDRFLGPAGSPAAATTSPGR